MNTLLPTIAFGPSMWSSMHPSHSPVTGFMRKLGSYPSPLHHCSPPGHIDPQYARGVPRADSKGYGSGRGCHVKQLQNGEYHFAGDRFGHEQREERSRPATTFTDKRLYKLWINFPGMRRLCAMEVT
eukprot:Sspe_Gene.72803::Locus_43615_Transcript_1_1_Confidence_1.000_Length_1389::g.72803::m.72803